MSETLDVYREWLEIEQPDRPLNYYQLLRLNQFEDNIDRIRQHYRKLNGHVRKYSAGEFATQSQELLNELARAMLCLTDLGRKAEYDESLGRTSAGDDRRRSLEDLLIRRKALDQPQLEKARKYAEATGFSLRDAIVQQKSAPQETVMQLYAESLGLPFLDMADVTIDESLFPKISAMLARSHSVTPVMIENDQLLLASPNPLDLQKEEDLRLRLGMPIRMVLCTPDDINRVISQHYPREAVDAEMADRRKASAGETAGPSRLEKIWNRVKKWVEENNKKK